MNGLSRDQIVEKLDEFKRLAQNRMKNVTPEENVRVKIVGNSEELADSGKNTATHGKGGD